MNKYDDSHSGRQESLKRVIARLHAGATVDEVKSEFAALLQAVDATEVATLEQALIAEGMPVSEIRRRRRETSPCWQE